MRGLLLLREFLLGTGARRMVRAAALAAGQRLAVLLRGARDDCGDFGVDFVAAVAKFTKFLCVQSNHLAFSDTV